MIGKQFTIKTDDLQKDVSKMNKNQLAKERAKLANRINTRMAEFEKKGMTDENGYKLLKELADKFGNNEKHRLSRSKKPQENDKELILRMQDLLTGRERTTVGKVNEQNRSIDKLASDNGLHLNSKEKKQFRAFFKTQEWKSACKMFGYSSAKEAILNRGLSVDDFINDFYDWTENSDFEEIENYESPFENETSRERYNRKRRNKRKAERNNRHRENNARNFESDKKATQRFDKKQTAELWNKLFDKE